MNRLNVSFLTLFAISFFFKLSLYTNSLGDIEINILVFLASLISSCNSAFVELSILVTSSAFSFCISAMVLAGSYSIGLAGLFAESFNDCINLSTSNIILVNSIEGRTTVLPALVGLLLTLPFSNV